jgi:hypothetical protein
MDSTLHCCVHMTVCSMLHSKGRWAECSRETTGSGVTPPRQSFPRTKAYTYRHVPPYKSTFLWSRVWNVFTVLTLFCHVLICSGTGLCLSILIKVMWAQIIHVLDMVFFGNVRKGMLVFTSSGRLDGDFSLPHYWECIHLHKLSSLLHDSWNVRYNVLCILVLNSPLLRLSYLYSAYLGLLPPRMVDLV